MPNKIPTLPNSIDKSRQRIHQAIRRGESCIKFVKFEEKQIIYKLNKYNYIQTDKLVINLHVLQYLSSQARPQNRIEYLYFDLCQIQDKGFRIFLEGNWNNLIFLDLSYNRLTVKSIEYLTCKANMNNLRSLRHLLLSGNMLNAQACHWLSKKQWPYLEELNLSFNSIGDIGLQRLSQHSWKKIKELHLRNISIGNKGVSGLIRMRIPQLQHLVLGDNRITDDGCKMLARGQWRQLKSLQIEGNYIKDEGLMHLTKLGSFNLSSLNIFASKTDVMPVQSEKTVVPTMVGLSYLTNGCWNRLKVDLSLGKYGHMNRDNFILDMQVRDMLELGNVTVNIIHK